MNNDFNIRRTASARLCAAALAALLTLTLHAQDNVIDEVVWVVGDEAILKSDVEEMRRYMMASGERIEGDPYTVIPEQLAIQKLFLEQAAIDSIEVTDNEVLADVDREINARISQIGSKEKMEEYFNMTTTQIREQLRETIRDRKTVERCQQKLFGDIKLTPAEVRRRYSAMSEDESPYVPTTVEVQIITQEPVIPQEEIDRIKSELRDYTERIQKGESSFSILALMYSQDPGSARKGGELDFMGRGELVPEFATVAFNLTDPNKISKIVETEYGYHIIQLIEKRGDRVKVRHILRKPEVSKESLDTCIARLDSIAEDIRREKFSFNEAAVLSADKDTRANFGIMTNPYDGSSRFEMQELPQEVARMVSTMNVGEISKPFTMIMEKTGKEVCAIVKLKNKVNGHKATVQDDFQTLKAVMVQQLQQEKMEKWIVEKQKSTYIRINERWRGGEFRYPGWIKDDNGN